MLILCAFFGGMLFVLALISLSSPACDCENELEDYCPLDNIEEGLIERIEEVDEKVNLLAAQLKLEFQHVPCHIELVKKQ